MAKQLSAEKLQELMLKVRKGACASLTWSQIQAIVEAIGGVVEPVVMSIHVREEMPIYGGEELATIKARAEQCAAIGPAFKKKPKVGDVLITSFSADECGKDSFGNKWHDAKAEALVAAQCYRIRLGDAETLIQPSKFRLEDHVRERLVHGEERRMRPAYEHDGIKWLSENGWVALINAKLGLEEHVPADERTLENTGSCPVCFRNIKLSPTAKPGLVGSMVLHGYRRPGDGATHGQCFGTGYHPFEHSSAGTVHYTRNVLTVQREQLTASLARLENGEQEEIYLARSKRVVRREDEDWDRVRTAVIESTKGAIASVNNEIETMQWLIDRWAPQPLPQVGSRVRGWLTEAWRGLRAQKMKEKA